MNTFHLFLQMEKIDRVRFAHCFARFIESRTLEKPKSDWHAILEFEKLGFNDRKGVWVFVGEMLQVPARKAHDYFYNTYQTLFYDDCASAEEKEEFERIFEVNLQRQLGSADAIKLSIEQFCSRHQEKQFCKRKLYQQLYRYSLIKQKHEGREMEAIRKDKDFVRQLKAVLGE